MPGPLKFLSKKPWHPGTIHVYFIIYKFNSIEFRKSMVS